MANLKERILAFADQSASTPPEGRALARAWGGADGDMASRITSTHMPGTLAKLKIST